jgi:hypothetical protein
MQDWATLTSEAVSESLESVIRFIPNILGAILVLLIGVLVAWAVKTVVVKVLRMIRLKPYTDAIGLNKVFTEKVEVVDLIGDLVKWIIVIIFVVPALQILNLTQINVLVSQVVAYLPNVVVAVAIIIIGAVIADLASRVVESTAHTLGTKTAAVSADVARWAIVVFAVLAALSQLGIATTIIDRLVTGFVAMFAIAGGLAFGLGGQDVARDTLDRVRKNMPKK